MLDDELGFSAFKYLRERLASASKHWGKKKKKKKISKKSPHLHFYILMSVLLFSFSTVFGCTLPYSFL